MEGINLGQIIHALRVAVTGKAVGWLLSFVLLWGMVFLLLHLTFYPFPNITHVLYGRDVGYSVERIILDDATEAISATRMRQLTAAPEL